MKNILFKPQCYKTHVLLHISSLFYVCKCRVRFSLVLLSLYGSTTLRAIIPVQHSPLGTGWGLHEEKRRDSTTKRYQKYDYQPVLPNRTSQCMLNHIMLGENLLVIPLSFTTEMYFLSNMRYIWARLGSLGCGEMFSQRRQDGAVSPARDGGAQTVMACEAFYMI